MYLVEWTLKSLKQLKRIAYNDQKTIVIAVRELKPWPNCKNVKPLRNRQGYRLRIGRYRVIFDVQKVLKIVKIEEVKKRDERTY